MKLRVVFAALLASIGVTVSGQQKFDIPVWGDKIAGEKDAVMTVYLPEYPNGMAVLMCPGGAYEWVAIDHEGHMQAPWYNERGIACIVLKYRIPENLNKTPLADASQAMRIIRQNAQKWGINPDRIGIQGASAGGHLASFTSVAPETEDARPNFSILVYPVISMDAEITNEGTRNQLIGKTPSSFDVITYSSDMRVDDNTPPAFIVLSADDKVVVPRNSLNYFEQLIKRNIPVEMHIYPTGGHGWGFKPDFKYHDQWASELENWLGNLY